MQKLTVSGSPHVHSGQPVQKIMWGVVLALIPAYLVSLWYFGLGALLASVVAVATCLAVEYAVARFVLKQEPTISDGSGCCNRAAACFQCAQ
jgi:electron transport complex protein RnfD